MIKHLTLAHAVPSSLYGIYYSAYTFSKAKPAVIKA